LTAREHAAMEHLSNAKRACAVAAASRPRFQPRTDRNLSSVADVLDQLEPEHPARTLLLDIRAAAPRCVYFSTSAPRVNPDPVRTSGEFRIDE
jgi:hypothetical protein